MDDYIKYKPSSVEWDKFKKEYWEVWEGIPDDVLRDCFSTRNGGLKYNKNYRWINISPEALNALRQNPKAVLCALLEKDSTYDKKVIRVFPSSNSLDETIKKVQDANKKLLDTN